MPRVLDAKKNEQLLSRNISEVVVREHLEKRLLAGEKLRIKLGADPTAPDLHLGHAVVLRKLRELQNLGHTVVFIIGDFTALIGDPTGKSKTRPPLEPNEIKKNAKTYFTQAGKILDMKKCEIHYNSEWFSKMPLTDFIKLRAQLSIKRILERDDFSRRMKNLEAELFAHETDYPILQAYDSVAVKADVEIGGTDQKFNMLTGRDLQRKLGMREQDVIICPLLIGLDGAQKMSKSLGNYIGLTDAQDEMYGKIMSVQDNLILQYFELVTDLPLSEIKSLPVAEKPRDVKMKLAREVVKMYHGEKASQAAEENFVRIFQKHERPEDIITVKVKNKSYKLFDLLVEIKFAVSKNEARRVILEKGVKVNEQVVDDPNSVIEIVKEGILIQKGKRYFVKILGRKI